MNVDPSSSPQERAAVARAALQEVRAQAGTVAMRGAGERLAHEAEAYLGAVELFRAEGFEPNWRSDDGAISFRPLQALDGAGEVSPRCKGIES